MRMASTGTQEKAMRPKGQKFMPDNKKLAFSTYICYNTFKYH